MHRPIIDWQKNKRIDENGTVEQQIFSATQNLIRLRKQLPMVADHSNLKWLTPYNIHIAGFVRQQFDKSLFCFFNFSNAEASINWQAVKETGIHSTILFDHWNKKEYRIMEQEGALKIAPYGFCLLEVKY